MTTSSLRFNYSELEELDKINMEDMLFCVKADCGGALCNNIG